jgi:hypothetical protein
VAGTKNHRREKISFIGRGVSYPHFDIQLFDNSDKNIFDKDVLQDENFPSYKSAINAVFMQIEKFFDRSKILAHSS